MARYRTIKPETWTDDKVCECSVSARLLFIGTWNFADDYGNLDRSPKQIKAQVFPNDSVDCEPLLLELIRVGLLAEYEVGGKKYLHINGFQKHQKIDKPSQPRFPSFNPSLITSGVLDEPSGSTRGALAPELNRRELNRKEGNREEGKGRNEPPSKSEPQPPKDSDLRVERILKTHPSSWTKDGVIPEYPHAWKAAVIEAIARSGAEAVEQGVKAYAAAVKRWPASERKFVKSPDKFFGPECHYLKDPAEWESENAVLPKPCQMENPADIIRRQIEKINRGELIAPGER